MKKDIIVKYDNAKNEDVISFAIQINDENNSGVSAMQKAHQIAVQRGIANMTLEEINAEIAEVRK